MAEKTKTLTISDWVGYINNQSPEDIPLGAATEQINLQSNEMGNLKSRKGYAPIAFASTTKVGLGPDA